MKPYYEDGQATFYQGDVIERLREMPENSVHTCVTSPPYWGLRDYGVEGQLGLEATPEEFIAKMVAVFREVRRVLREDGTLWLNIGDSYAGSGKGPEGNLNNGSEFRHLDGTTKPFRSGEHKPKDLVGIPWMLAFALRADGWYLRQDIIWAKSNPMPESVTDRCTKAHEYLFLLTKSARYYYDQEAIREANDPDSPFWRTHPQGQKAISRTSRLDGNNEAAPNTWLTGLEPGSGRNKRSVWTIATEAFSARALGGGTTGIRSADCPVHGDSPLAAQARQAARRDAQRDAAAPGSDGTGNHPAPLPPLEQSSNGATRSDSDYQPETQPERIEGSTPSRKTLASLPRGGDPLAGDQTPTSTERTSVECVAQVGSSDSGDQSRVASAKGRSSENHKTGHAPETIQPYTASAQNEPSTPRMSELPGFFDSAAHTSVSSTAPADSDGHPSAQTQSRTAGKLSCSCIVPDHFATFPTALVKPCILAGTSERGVCSQCGAPWVRETEVQDPNGRLGKAYNDHTEDMSKGLRGVPPAEGAPIRTTLGWAPSCKHEAPPVPATVLDPFLGSGTTAYVAKSLGRHAVGIDLNPEYLELARRRCAQMGLEMVS